MSLKLSGSDLADHMWLCGCVGNNSRLLLTTYQQLLFVLCCYWLLDVEIQLN